VLKRLTRLSVSTQSLVAEGSSSSKKTTKMSESKDSVFEESMTVLIWKCRSTGSYGWTRGSKTPSPVAAVMLSGEKESHVTVEEAKTRKFFVC
jgi:hypothetical protein